MQVGPILQLARVNASNHAVRIGYMRAAARVFRHCLLEPLGASITRFYTVLTEASPSLLQQVLDMVLYRWLVVVLWVGLSCCCPVHMVSLHNGSGALWG